MRTSRIGPYRHTTIVESLMDKHATKRFFQSYPGSPATPMPYGNHGYGFVGHGKEMVATIIEAKQIAERYRLLPHLFFGITPLENSGSLADNLWQESIDPRFFAYAFQIIATFATAINEAVGRNTIEKVNFNRLGRDYIGQTFSLEEAIRLLGRDFGAFHHLSPTEKMAVLVRLNVIKLRLGAQAPDFDLRRAHAMA